MPTRFKHLRLGRPWCEAIELTDGRRLILRPIQPSDAQALSRSFLRLSPEEVRLRFLHPLRELTPEYATRLVSLDPKREFALVLVECRPPEEALIGAVARCSVDESGQVAEFAIIVGREIARQGLGRYLLSKLIEWSRKKKLYAIQGHVLNDNHAMLGLSRKLGFELDYDFDPEDEIVLVRKPLGQAARGQG